MYESSVKTSIKKAKPFLFLMRLSWQGRYGNRFHGAMVEPIQGGVPSIRRAFAFLLLVAFLAVYSSYAQASENRYRFDIEEQELGSALDAFVKITGARLIYPEDLAHRRGINPVKGVYTLREALDALLLETSFSGGLTKSGVIVVSLSKSAKAQDLEGNMPKRAFKKSLMASVATFFMGANGGAVAQDANTDDSMSELEEIVIVGSSIKSAADYDTNSRPIQYVSEKKFKLTRGEHVAEFLRELPINAGYSETAATSEYSGGTSDVNLRGVGSEYTLMMVGGRRLYGGDIGVDLGSIPPLAVEGVEVLKSGASSIYGSDAVAGVVNIRLKRNYEGLELQGSYGQTTRGDAGTLQLGALFGVVEEKLSFTGSFAYQDRGGFTKFDRDITSTRDFRRFGGIDRRSSSLGMPHRIFLSNGDVLSIDPTRFSAGDYTGNLSDYVPYDHETQAIGTHEISTYPEFERYSGHWGLEYKLIEDKIHFFSEGFADYRTMPEFQWENSVFFIDVPSANPYNPFGEDVSVLYLMGDLGPENYDFQSLNWHNTLGIEGTLNGYNYEISYTHQKVSRETIYTNFTETNILSAAVNRTDSLAFNPFGYYANSAEQVNLIRLGEMSVDDTAKLQMIDAKVDGELFTWSQGTAYFAAGYQHRKEEYNFRPDQSLQTLDIFDCGYDSNGASFCAETPYETSRKIDAFFGEIKMPLYQSSNNDAFIQFAELSGAIRHEKYSDFGKTTVWQTSGRIGIWNDSIILRGGYSKSFRAPDIFALSATESIDIDESFFFDPVFGAVSPVTIVEGGNPDLDPEKGKTFNLGIVFRPQSTPNFSLSLDYWTLDITDRIDEPNVQAVMDGTALSGTLTRDPITQHPTVDARYDNGGSREASGFDLAVNYRLNTEASGTFTFDLNATRLNKFTDFGNDGVSSTSYVGTYTAAETIVPKYRAVASTLWQKGGFDVSGVAKYTSGFTEELFGGGERDGSSYITIDFQIAYQFDNEDNILQGTRLYAGLENAFDKDPVFVATSSNGWDRSLHDYRGRYFYFGIRKQFQ